jgi:hypothetical protein
MFVYIYISTLQYLLKLAFRAGRPGQPCFGISPEQIYFLLRLRFTVSEVARILGVCVRTVRRRMDSRGVRVRRLYSQVPNAGLDSLVCSLVEQHPNAGYRMMQAYLCAEGVRLQEPRVRASLRRVDPAGILRCMNRHRCINRRVYSVTYPNALWDIDGNMTLISYAYVLQCCKHIRVPCLVLDPWWVKCRCCEVHDYFERY